MRLARGLMTGRAIALVVLTFGVAGCSSAPHGSTGRPSPTSAGAPRSTTSPGRSSTSRPPVAVTIDPCADLTAALVSDLVGFSVTGDGATTNNGNGFVSCQFSAPVDAQPTAGATVVIGAEPVADLDEIRATLRAMAPAHAPTEVDLGDGGYLQAERGFAELRVNTRRAQIEVNIITPVDRSLDLGPLATKVATRVVADVS